MTPSQREALSAGTRLALAAALASALLAGVHALTRERIAEAERRQQQQALALVLPADRYDNDLLADRIQVDAPSWLGEDQRTVYRARRDGADRALIIEATAPDGYAGPIRLLIAVDIAGQIEGVRISQHRETPGLGDGIVRPEWLATLLGRSLSNPTPERWHLRRDGGDFDALAGATITPRAVVVAVRRCLAFVAVHREALFSAEPGSRLQFEGRADDTATR